MTDKHENQAVAGAKIVKSLIEANREKRGTETLDKKLERLSMQLVTAWDCIDDHHGTEAEIDAAIQKHISAIKELAFVVAEREND